MQVIEEQRHLHSIAAHKEWMICSLATLLHLMPTAVSHLCLII